MLELNGEVCTLTFSRTTVFKHKIYIRHEVPIKQRSNRLSPAKLVILNEQLKSMLPNGVVEPSFSGWASLVVLIPKKDGGYRFCVDYRKPNAITESDAYPLPNINDLLESLSGATVFSNLYLNNGYWQVAMDPASQDKTAFITPAGLYSFKVMPVGLKNAPATFQSLRGKCFLVYLDGIIIYCSVTDHLQDIQTLGGVVSPPQSHCVHHCSNSAKGGLYQIRNSKQNSLTEVRSSYQESTKSSVPTGV
jgi:hypothetical protein